MKRWIILGVLVLALAGLALSSGVWVPWLLGFVIANSDLIQGLEALTQIILWVGVGILVVLGLKKAPGSEDSPTTEVNGMLVEGDLNLTLTDAARDILRPLRPGLSPEALQTATEAYLHYLLDRYRFLNLKGMGVTDRVPLRLPLLDLYIPLKARLSLPENETWRREVTVAGRQLTEEAQAALTGHLGKPQDVLALLQDHDGLIILGDPGAGKTTFLKVLALNLALGQGESLGLNHRLPVLVPLSAFANALAENDVRLDDFVAGYFHDIGADLPIAALIAESLNKGTALILLDGLDEVRNPALRETVVRRVVDFYTLHRRQGNKFVLTSRIVGYREVRPTAPGLAECTLVDFDTDEITDFVTRWTRALERQATGEGQVAWTDAERERRALMTAIEHNPSVRRLAANPLLLTILALMKRQGVTLPDRRVELYDRYVRTLLSSWNRARGLGRPPTRDLDVVQTVRVLAPLALWMHEENPGVGLVKREALRRRLEAIFADRGEDDPAAAARRFLADVHDYAGVLLERGPGQYGFIHLTFEEYLAAVAIALRGQGNCRPIVDTLSLHVDDAAWREVALLTVPYLGIIQQLDRVAGEVVEALASEQPGPPGAAVVLAGRAALDAGDTGVPARSRKALVPPLVAAMQSADVAQNLRREAGLVLGRMGWRPADLDAFVEVPPGSFQYGDNREPREIKTRYWIGKYPVTNVQYARFIEDGGYRRQEFWTGEGWAWREQELRDQPGWWDNSDVSESIFPVMGISFYEAEAYCFWLTAQLRSRVYAMQVVGANGPASAALSPDGLLARLPSEEEWERAARGKDGGEFPWGDSSEPWRANTAVEVEGERSYVGSTAVCTYPQGVSFEGVYDMAGNVWEWTSSTYDRKSGSRVLRGGSSSLNRRSARCASRWYFPGNFDLTFGFRVVVSLVDSES